MPDDALAKLKDAKKSKRSWVETASLFRSGMAGEGEGRAFFERRVAAMSGYSLGMLKRFDSILSFVESLPEKLRPRPDVADASFTKLEMIERLSRHDEAKARGWLAKLGQRGVRVAAIKEDLKTARAPKPIEYTEVPPKQNHLKTTVVASRSYSASVRGWREDKAMDQVGEMLPKLSGKAYLFHKPPGTNTSPVRFDAVAWLDGIYGEADGFEFAYAPSQMTHAQFGTLVSRAVLAATFFRRYYLVFTGDSDGQFPSRATHALDQLGADSVGVVWLGGEKPKKPLRAPTGLPVPDRRSKLRIICPNGRWA